MSRADVRARPGVIDLRDLTSRYAWHPLAVTRFLEAAGLVVADADAPATDIDAPDADVDALTARSFAPPPVVVAIAPADDPSYFGRSRAWLDDAAHVIAVRAHVAGEVDEADDEELFAPLWREELERLRAPAECFDWRRDEDVPAILERAVALALALASQPPPSQSQPSPSQPLPLPQPAAADIVEHPPGPRIPVEASATLDHRVVASRVTRSHDSVLFYSNEGPIDLCAPREPAGSIAVPGNFMAGAITPQGRWLLVERRQRWKIDDHAFEMFGYLGLGFDGRHPVGWTGLRMHVYWLYAGRHGTGFLSSSDHDFPCGPGKKLYGYKDNDPVEVSLAPDLDVVAYRFEHDVLVTSAIPIAWRAAGAVSVADFPRDPARAVLFARTADGFPVDDLLDEDARDLSPGLVLGPTAAARYAVDLTETVYRVTSLAPNTGAVAKVGGPDEGFAVFDADHQLVRRARGKLLGGWWRWATILDDGAYWREDLATGDRQRVAAAEGEPVFAVAIPWTKNVVVVLGDDEQRWLALV